MNITSSIKKMGFVTKSKYDEVRKGLKIAMDGLLRPGNRLGMFEQTSLLLPIYPYPIATIKNLALQSDTLTTIHVALKKELFRNGYNLEEAEKTDEEVTTSQEELVATKEWSRYEILEFLECANENKQNITDVLKELEDDFNIWDDAFMLFMFTYGFNVKQEIVERELDQVMRVDPNVMGLVLNARDRPGFDDDNRELTVCPEHRSTLLTNTDICPMCGKKTYRAIFFAQTNSNRLYYYQNEVVHKSKFRPSKRRGFSPVLTLWQKTRTLVYMDKYIMDLYTGQRPPKAGLFFKTSNAENLDAAWKTVEQRAKENPHMPLVMAVPDTSNGNDFVKFIDFMKSLDELQHTDMRNEYRRQMGAMYGVEPLFQNDISTSGGLNNEGLQVTVTNRTVEDGQALYNIHFLAAIIKSMGLHGWTLTLNPSEEQDQMAKLVRQSTTLDNGLKAVTLGLEAEFSTDTGEVVIKDGALEKPAMDMGFDDGFDMSSGSEDVSSGEPKKSLKKKD